MALDSRPRPARVAALRSTIALIVLAALAAFGWWWSHPPRPERQLRAYERPLVRLERKPASHLGSGFEWWTMIGPERDTVTGLWRAPRQSPPRWVAVLLGGIGTDDRAALLIPDSLTFGVLAVSWPWKGPRRMSRFAFLGSVPAMREAMLRTPAAIARGVEAVRRSCPGSRVVLVGVSLGVPPTTAALPLAHPEALALVDGAADLARLMHAEILRELGRRRWARLIAGPAAALGARLMSSLEPSRYGAEGGTHAKRGSGVPVLLVDAGRDDRYPPGCVARLHAAFPGAATARHPDGHITPTNTRAIADIAEIVRSWLQTLGPGAGPARAPL
jgi:hypothetical protein